MARTKKQVILVDEVEPVSSPIEVTYFTQEECYSLIRLSQYVVAHTNKGYICYNGTQFQLLSEVPKQETERVTFDYQDFKKFLKANRLTLIFH